MLARWLDPDPSVLPPRPTARPNAWTAPDALFDWDRLGAVLAASAPEDVLVVRGGRLRPLRPPRSAAEMMSCLAAGLGVNVRHAERHDPALAALADALVADLAADLAQGARAHVQLFATAEASHGFGWHYDDESVFIVQVAGEKDYYLRENTVAAGFPAHPEMFARFPDERSALFTSLLHAGDALFLPSRWWHMAVARTHCLSISIGVSNDASTRAARRRTVPARAPNDDVSSAMR